MKNKETHLVNVIKKAFLQTGFDKKYFHVFDDQFRKVNADVISELGIDAIENPDVKFEPDDEPGECNRYIIEYSTKLTKHYVKSKKQGHSDEFASKYIDAMYVDMDDDNDATRKAYKSINKNSDTGLTMSNPAYAEAYRVTKAERKSDIYAKKYAQEIVENDCSIAKVEQIAGKYEAAYLDCKKNSGHSDLYIDIYADCVSRDYKNYLGKYGHIFAQCYEQKIESGMDKNAAMGYADNVTDYFSNHNLERYNLDSRPGYIWENEHRDDPDTLFWLEEATVFAEGTIRGIKKKTNSNTKNGCSYADIFLSKYENIRWDKDHIPIVEYLHALDIAEKETDAFFENK